MKSKLTGNQIQPLLTQSDLDSASADDFFYLENTLPPIPQYRGYLNLEADNASLHSSSLANWDGKVIDNTTPCRHQSTPAYINIGMGYDGSFGCTASQDDDASITIPCLPDIQVVEARRVTVQPEMICLSYPRSTFHEVGGRVDALLYHQY